MFAFVVQGERRKEGRMQPRQVQREGKWVMGEQAMCKWLKWHFGENDLAAFPQVLPD